MIRAPGFVMGLGLGGLIDGVVLHQVLQWHHMLTGDRSAATVAGLEANPLADGFFRARARLAHLRRDAAGRLGRVQPGRGVIDHQVLGVHHVRDPLGAPLGWDLAFLGLGVTLVAGLGLARQTRRAAAR